MMVETVRDFSQSGVDIPILVGGAALSSRFTRMRIAPEYRGLVAYAPDAMAGLALANTIHDIDERERLTAALAAESRKLLAADKAQASRDAVKAGRPASAARVDHDIEIPKPPDLLPHVLRDYDLEKIFPYVNPQMLYVRHLGFMGPLRGSPRGGRRQGPGIARRRAPGGGCDIGTPRYHCQCHIKVLSCPVRWPVAAGLRPPMARVSWSGSTLGGTPAEAVSASAITSFPSVRA